MKYRRSEQKEPINGYFRCQTVSKLMIHLPLHESLAPFAKDIFFLKDNEPEGPKKLPFYADGFSGIIYCQSSQPFYQQPRGKKLSDFYLYGQTIDPITLETNGSYHMIIIRLYPFAVRMLLGVNPQLLNDDCYDLQKVENVDTLSTLNQLKPLVDPSEMMIHIATYFNKLLANASLNPDYRIKLAISLILRSSGDISIKELREKLCVGKRTLERHFLKEIGVTAKQFANMVQFSSSLKQMTDSNYASLTAVGHDNGFADQSHFIRTFKKFTGKTPREFQKQISI